MCKETKMSRSIIKELRDIMPNPVVDNGDKETANPHLNLLTETLLRALCNKFITEMSELPTIQSIQIKMNELQNICITYNYVMDKDMLDKISKIGM
jgi:hypothetical protein